MARKKLTLEAAREVVACSKGASEHELTGRHLLLHPDEIPMATDVELAALDDFVRRKGWRKLWHHDKPMSSTAATGGRTTKADG